MKAPPGGVVEWEVVYDGKPLKSKANPSGIVRAQTWYEAREQAYRTMDVEARARSTFEESKLDAKLVAP